MYILKSKYLQITRSVEGIKKFPPWFSLGFHIDFQKKYIDIHIYDFIITIGTPYWYKEMIK